MKKLAAMGILMSLVCLPCAAAKRDGNQLYEWIKAFHRWEERRASGGDQIEAANLVGFINGAIDYGLASDRFCLPINTSTSQVIAIVEKSLTEFPEKRNKSAVVLIDSAMMQAFPCSK
jgi:hypothetical protein